jgi:zinc protease
MTSLLDAGAGPYTADQFHGRLDDLSVRFNIDVGLDNVTGSLRTLTQNRDAAFDLLRVALIEPHFDADAIERVREQMRSLLREEESSADTIASRTLMRKLFAGHPYAQSRNGTPQTIEAITVQDLRDVHRRLLVRDRLFVAVVGDIEAGDLAKLLDTAFGALPMANAPIDTPPWPTAQNPAPPGSVVVVQRDIPQSVVTFAEPGIKRDDPDWFPAYVMNYVLGGGGFSSRLTAEVREKRGLAYSLSTGLSTYRAGGLIYGTVGTANARVAQSIELIRSEWQRLADKGITEQELADAKTYLTGSFALNLDSTSSIASLLLQMQLDNLGIDYLQRRAGLIEGVTVADVQRVARRLIDPAKLTFVVVGKPAGVQSTN